MELVLLVVVVLSAATNIFLIKQVKTVVNIAVPVPEVYVTVEAAEPQAVHYALDSAGAVSYNFDKLEEILRRLVELQTAEQPPFLVPPPMPIPQPPSPYWQRPVLSKDTTNETEIDGVKGKKFPAR